ARFDIGYADVFLWPFSMNLRGGFGVQNKRLTKIGPGVGGGDVVLGFFGLYFLPNLGFFFRWVCGVFIVFCQPG
ncbi:hypothetical protein, partial [Neisseria sp. P0014.S006]|uniref:hypothetical protein n=1 Tax=Neisseria sp. P0014.S006 TaxID=3436752 RepID=UPI003F7FF5C4